MITPQGLLTPTNAWAIIAEYIEPNALSYMKISKICRASRLVFTADKLWRDLVPIDNVQNNYYGAFIDGVGRLSAAKTQLAYSLWTDLMDRELRNYPELSLVDGDPILSLPYVLWMQLYITHTPAPTQEAHIQLAALELWKNKTFCMRTCSVRGTMIQYVSDTNDLDIISCAVHSRIVPHLQLINADLRNRRDIVIPIVSKRDCLSLADSSLWSDKAVIVAALGASWRPITLAATSELKDDKEIALLAINKSGRALEYLSTRLQNDAKVVYRAVANYGLALQHASQELQNNQGIVREAISKDGRALKYASTTLRNTDPLVLEAVTNDGRALEFASDRLKRYKRIVRAAVKQNGCSFRYASESLKDDEDFCAKLVKLDDRALQYASAHIQASLRRKRARKARD